MIIIWFQQKTMKILYLGNVTTCLLVDSFYKKCSSSIQKFFSSLLLSFAHFTCPHIFVWRNHFHHFLCDKIESYAWWNNIILPHEENQPEGISQDSKAGPAKTKKIVLNNWSIKMTHLDISDSQDSNWIIDSLF